MQLNVCGESLEIEYIDEGEGEVVLLLHGWGAKAATYRCIIDMLTPHFRVVAPDMPGFGGSSEPSFPYTAQHYADFVTAFCQKLSIERAYLIGHSHGGRTAIKLLGSKNPPIAVPKLVLFDSAGLIRKKSLSQRLKIAKFKLAKRLQLLPIISKLLPPDYIEALRKKNGSADYAAASPIMRQSMVSVINEDLSACLCNITAPTLLIWGENDTDTPLYMAKAMEASIPDCGLVTIAGGGHFSFLADPILTQKVLYSFLDVK